MTSNQGTVPENANEVCVGLESSMAGKADSCQGCPNQQVCASGKAQQPTEDIGVIHDRLADVKHKLLVLSGKGGVGKSTVACQLAFSLALKGFQVGLLDVDICGPSVPRMLGLTGQEVHQSSSGWCPVYVGDNLGVMSIGFMLPSQDDAIIWRGPRKNGLIKQFLTDVDWGELDYLVIDTPPGTSDEHISVVQYLKGANVDGAVVVTTSQEVAMMDVRKELSFCSKTKIPVIGVVENMASLFTPFSSLQFRNENGIEVTEEILEKLRESVPEIFSTTIQTEVFTKFAGGPKAMAEKFQVPYLGSVPLDPNLLRACEEGVCFLSAYPSSPATRPFNDIVEKIIHATGEDYPQQNNNNTK